MTILESRRLHELTDNLRATVRNISETCVNAAFQLKTIHIVCNINCYEAEVQELRKDYEITHSLIHFILCNS